MNIDGLQIPLVNICQKIKKVNYGLGKKALKTKPYCYSPNRVWGIRYNSQGILRNLKNLTVKQSYWSKNLYLILLGLLSHHLHLLLKK